MPNSIDHFLDLAANVNRWALFPGDVSCANSLSYLTDLKVEHRKSRWKIEVAIKLADDYAKNVHGAR